MTTLIIFVMDMTKFVIKQKKPPLEGSFFNNH